MKSKSLASMHSSTRSSSRKSTSFALRDVALDMRPPKATLPQIMSECINKQRNDYDSADHDTQRRSHPARRCYGMRPCTTRTQVAFRLRRVACSLTYALSTRSMRACQPSPVPRKYAMTSGLYRTDTSIFLFADFGRPRRVFNGTIALSCALVSGCASGSDLAAARILAFFSAEGIRMTRLAVAFDIVIDLIALCMSETDDSSDFASVNERNVVERVAFRDEPDHSDLVVWVPGIDPYECLVPNQLPGERQRQTVPSAVQRVFGGIKVDQHAIL